MKARTSIFIVIMLVSMLFAIPAPVQATKPEPLIIDAVLWFTGENSAAGTFYTSGLFEDVGDTLGDASEIFFITKDFKTIHGVKILKGAEGTITMKFQASLTWTSDITLRADGRYTISSGTGAYEKLHGVGISYAEINLYYGTINATYTGTGHID